MIWALSNQAFRVFLKAKLFFDNPDYETNRLNIQESSITLVMVKETSQLPCVTVDSPICFVQYNTISRLCLLNFVKSLPFVDVILFSIRLGFAIVFYGKLFAEPLCVSDININFSEKKPTLNVGFLP